MICPNSLACGAAVVQAAESRRIQVAFITAMLSYNDASNSKAMGETVAVEEKEDDNDRIDISHCFVHALLHRPAASVTILLGVVMPLRSASGLGGHSAA